MLLIDEVLAVGDGEFQLQCVERIAEIALNDDDKAGFKKSVDAVHGLMAAAKTIAPDLA